MKFLVVVAPPSIYHGFYTWKTFWEKILTEVVMDKLDMFQSRFEKIDEFGWWDLERISEDAGSQFTLVELKEE